MVEYLISLIILIIPIIPIVPIVLPLDELSPFAAHGLVDEAVGFIVVDEGLRLRVEVERAG